MYTNVHHRFCQAEKEEAAYESHKRATRLTHVQMQPQRLGSGEERLVSLPGRDARKTTRKYHLKTITSIMNI